MSDKISKPESPPDQFFFEKIENAKERESIFNLVTYERKNVLIKSPKGFFTTPLNFLIAPQTFTLVDKPDPKIGLQFEGTLHFELKGLKYLCKGKFYTTLTTMKVDIESLYYVQRRNSFRVKLPESYLIHFMIEELNNKPLKKKCKVLDLSSKGIKLHCSEKLKKGDLFTGYLIHSNTAPTLLKGEVLHISADPKNKTFFNLGIQFIEHSAEAENFLFLYTLELYRKIYHRKEF